MNESFIFDLIILIGFVFFIFTRFFGSKLPKDDAKKRPNQQRNLGTETSEAAKEAAKVVDIKRKNPLAVKPRKPTLSPDVLAKLQGAERLKAFDPSFDEKEFLSGARQAFTLYWQAIAEGDEATLEALTSPRLFDEAMEQIEDLAASGKVFLTRIDKIKTIEILETRVSGRTAIADVKYTAELAQVNVKKTSKTTTAKASTYQAVWVWARNIDAPDLNWELEEIKPLN